VHPNFHRLLPAPSCTGQSLTHRIVHSDLLRLEGFHRGALYRASAAAQRHLNFFTLAGERPFGLRASVSAVDAREHAKREREEFLLGRILLFTTHRRRLLLVGAMSQFTVLNSPVISITPELRQKLTASGFVVPENKAQLSGLGKKRWRSYGPIPHKDTPMIVVYDTQRGNVGVANIRYMSIAGRSKSFPVSAVGSTEWQSFVNKLVREDLDSEAQSRAADEAYKAAKTAFHDASRKTFFAFNVQPYQIAYVHDLDAKFRLTPEVEITVYGDNTGRITKAKLEIDFNIANVADLAKRVSLAREMLTNELGAHVMS